MARNKKEKRDPISIAISAVIHLLLIGGIGYWAHQSGMLDEVKRRILQAVRSEKDKPKELPKPVQQKAPPSKLPPINQGVPQQASSGSRRAVAADAPAAVGDSFFADTRKQGAGPASAGSGGASTAPQIKVVVVPPPPPPPRPALAAAATTSIKQLLAERSKAAASTESFGSEQISKTGVSDAGAIINKVSGASVVDGKFAVIRGLNDRYVTTTLNGGEIPSADPYRKSASLDLFPAQIISKVVVAKTFTPDQPGTYTGGGIDIVTKSFPEKSFASISVGAEYNTQATGNKNFLTYEGGQLDWLGMDDGTRALPDALAAPNLIVPFPPFNSGRPTAPTYEQRIADAEKLNALTTLMGTTQFAPTRDAPPPNQKFAAAAGETTHLFGLPLGVFTGLSYKHDYSFYEDGIRRSYVPGNGVGTFDVRSDYADTKATEVVNWAGVVNLAYQLSPDHELNFNFLYNQNSEDQARQLVGTTTDKPDAVYYQNRLQFIERNLNTYQLKGAHVLPKVGGIKFDWLASYSQTSQDEPDVRFFNYADQGGDFIIGDGSSPDPKNPTRYFRQLEEDNRNLKAGLTIPVRQWSWYEGEFKVGVFDSTSERTFIDREVYYQGEAPFNGDPNAYLTPGNLGYTAVTNAGRVTWTWNRYLQTRDSAYTGHFGVQAGYAMLDLPVLNLAEPLRFLGQPILEKIRLIGGVRYETTDLSINSRSYLANSTTGKSTNSTSLDQTDLLPGIGLVIGMRSNMNVRLSYSQTIARPSFRELAGYRSYDPTLDVLLDGNPNLKLSAINNFDLRWEWFPRPGELFGISLFYKDLENAIERRFVTTDGEIVSFANRESANVGGIEFEARKSLDFLDPHLSNFSLGANLSLIQSETALTREEIVALTGVFGKGNVEPTRSLYDQSPYILNLDLSYDNPRSGTSASIIFNTAGPRITIASLNTEDIYEQPAPTLDFILSQKLGRHMSLKFSAKNLLDPAIRRTYGKGTSRLYSSYRRGLLFGISLGYDF